MHTRPIFAFLVVSTLAGCDQSYGVERTATVEGMPTPDRVLAAVRSVPGVDSAAYEPTFEHPDTVVTVYYRGGTCLYAVLQFVRGDNGVAYANAVRLLNRPPPQRDIDALYPVMLAVEARVATLPGFGRLGQSVVQTCTGVRCPTLPSDAAARSRSQRQDCAPAG